MLTYLDLFAGAGGLSLGLKAAGFCCVGAVELDDQASSSYRLNFPDHLSNAPIIRLGREEGDACQLEPLQVRQTLSYAGVGEGELDLLVAGPPCQGFSHIGRSKLDNLASQRGAFQHDRRNSLYLTVTDLVPVLQPRALLIENVPGILSHARVNVAERIAETIEEAGYTCKVAVLNAAWYGVPQTRERIFILGIREDLGIPATFPEPAYAADLTPGHLAGEAWVAKLFTDRAKLTVLKTPKSETQGAVSVQQAIGDLPHFTRHLEDNYSSKKEAKKKPQEYTGRPIPGSYDALMRTWDVLPESESICDHYARYTPRDHETFRLMQPGDKYPEAVQVARRRYVEALLRYRSERFVFAGTDRPARSDYVPPYPVASFNARWRKLVPDLPSWTITAHLSKDGYSHIHFDDRQARCITPREAARLQSFPDAFRFVGNMGDTFRQIGNAVPPLLARELGSHIARALAEPTGNAVSHSQRRIVETHSGKSAATTNVNSRAGHQAFVEPQGKLTTR